MARISKKVPKEVSKKEYKKIQKLVAGAAISKPDIEKHGNLIKVEINFKHKYLTLVSKDGFIISINGSDFNKVKEAFAKET